MLSLEEIYQNVKRLPGWGLEDSSLTKEFNFNDFSSSIKFVNAVAKLAEDRNHHPDILISHTKVRLSLTTHSEKGLTEKDFQLAQAIDSIFKK